MGEASVMERRRIVRFAHEHGSELRAVATLVRVEGSSYRTAGARLLIGSGGQYAGTVSGGCLEAEVVKRSVWKVGEGAVVDRYSTEFDDTAEIPYGLGCGGVLDLLLEPAGTAEFAALLAALEDSLAGKDRTVGSWLPQPGHGGLRRAVWTAAGEVVFRSEGLAVAEVAAAASGRAADVFLERLRAPQRLVIFGAGEDAKPLVSMAALLGWGVVVADARGRAARPERFPEAEHVTLAATAAAAAVAPGDAVVLMTHSYEQDRALLAELLAMPQVPRYVGLLGARHRTALVVSEAAAAAGLTLEQACAHLFAPIGLDLGGDGAEAIALAIVAEIQASLEGRQAERRRLSAAEIAQGVAVGNASRYLEAQCALGAE